MKRLENRLNVTDDEARVLALLAAVVMLGMVVFSFALGETEPWQESRWVFCDGTLRVRSAPGGEVAGYVFLGDEVTVDRLKGDWAHLTGLSIEAGEGWVAVRYLADSKATILLEQTVGTIQATGRVAVRQGMEGKRLFWVHPGDTVEVLAVTDDWVLIEGGMIRRSYVETEGEAE